MCDLKSLIANYRRKNKITKNFETSILFLYRFYIFYKNSNVYIFYVLYIQLGLEDKNKIKNLEKKYTEEIKMYQNIKVCISRVNVEFCF